MKKALSIIALAVSGSLMLVGCGSDKVGKESAEETTTAAVAEEETTAEETVPEEIPAEEPEAPAEEVKQNFSDGGFDFEISGGEASVKKYSGSDTDIVIPAETNGVPVTAIGFYAFEAQTAVTSVSIPDSVTKICEGAFIGCTSLSSINIPENVSELQRGVFVDCTSLTEIKLPASVQRVMEECFTGCTSLVSLTIENPDLAYESWGLEELPQLNVYAPDGSAAAEWAASLKAE